MNRIAFLSNTNVDPIINKISEKHLIYKPSGFGNIFEELLNSESELKQFGFNILFLFVDLSELLVNDYTVSSMNAEIRKWFALFESCIDNKVYYFIFEADMREMAVSINLEKHSAAYFENLWNDELVTLAAKYSNIYVFPYKNYVNEIGKQSFYSDKLWYLGRIPFSEKGRQAIGEGISDCLFFLEGKTKKVLILDLDNTLWGGLAGENNNIPIQLSNEKTGLIYKSFQRGIKRIKNTGILLAIVSKNNEKDVKEIINNNSHMILTEEDFVLIKANWEQKDKNILKIAEELNLGLDSFVFIDDNPAERELIRLTIPEVEVPEFPDKIEKLPAFSYELYNRYFKKLVFSQEDQVKTEQYQANAKRNELKKDIKDFASYLKNLNIKVMRVNAEENKERLFQLVNKTNQFNLTTKRYTYLQIEEFFKQNDTSVYLFEISDKFGSNGITAAVIIKFLEVPHIDSFILSCRVMGKFIENYIIELVEEDMRKKGFKMITATYYKTEKNAPVESFYDSLGYNLSEKSESCKKYTLDLTQVNTREYYVNLK